jgi:ankyrin repeat protein
MEEAETHLRYPGTLFKNVKTAEMAQLLLDAGIDVNDGLASDYDEEYISTPLHAAIGNSDDIDLIRTLIRSGANVNASGSGKSSGETPLMVAVQYEKVRIIKELLDSGVQVDKYGSDPERRGVTLTALQLAARYCGDDIVEMLLGAGADVNKPAIGWKGETALQGAVESDTKILCGFCWKQVHT